MLKEKTKYSSEKEDKIIEFIEQGYLEKRPNLVYKKQVNEKNSDTYNFIFIIFSAMALPFSIIGTILMPFLYESVPLVILTVYSGLLCVAVALAARIITAIKSEKIDSIIKYSDMTIYNSEKLNSDETKEFIKKLNPKLFKIINNSKLAKPINITTDFTIYEKDEIYEFVKELEEKEKEEKAIINRLGLKSSKQLVKSI